MRYHGLDLARAVFMVLGIVYHSAVIYKIDADWRVTVEHGSIVFTWIANFITDFRMPAFFIIAGFFYVLLVEKYSTKRVLMDRLTKLGIPTIVVGFSLNTIMNNLSGDFTTKSGLEYILSDEWHGHLWFIITLLVYSLISIPAARLFVKDVSPMCRMRYILVAAMIAVPLALTLSYFALIKTSELVGVNLYKTFWYYPYFILGMTFYSVRAKFVRAMNFYAFITFLLAYFLLETVLAIGLFEFSWTLGVRVVPHLTSLLLALSMIALCNSLARPSKMLNKLVDSSYTIYLFHQPLIVMGFYMVQPLAVNNYLSFTILSVSVLLVSYWVHVVIKSNYILTVLFNGKLSRKPMNKVVEPI